VNGAVKCQQISGGDGYSTMADGTQTFMFSFGPLSGLADIAKGLPGTQFPNIFNSLFTGTLVPGDPATTDGASDSPYTQGAPVFTWNGAVGQVPDLDANNGNGTTGAPIDGHVDPRQIMDVGVMNGNIPAPLIAFDEDDEFFLTLTNVGMIMRPDLFEQHTVHFHGYPNASSFYDGVPDASVAINIGGSFTYYYLSPDAGTYFWHCHITPPEHLQMGMVGQLYVRPRQNRVPSGGSLYTYLGYQNGIGLSSGTIADPRTACNPAADILCSATMPAVNTGATQGVDKLGNPQKYVYNDGDASTAYDVEYPLQMHGFDPNFHFVGMTFNPEAFVDMKDKYFLLNGRSYPDTVGQAGGLKTISIAPGPQATQSADGRMHYSQPLPALINIPVGGKAALRLANLSVSEYHTIASLGVPMKVVGWNAKLLRDQGGNNTEYYANSITLGGGESADVILDASNSQLLPAGSVFYLYTPQLDHLSNDAENFGGLMTEVHICNSVSSSTFGNTCN
jgi:FtsP/CotA-like multicopper oxidase with cupredoxin domain